MSIMTIKIFDHELPDIQFAIAWMTARYGRGWTPDSVMELEAKEHLRIWELENSKVIPA